MVATGTAVVMTERELERNMRAVEHGIAQQRLSGLTVSDATIEDMRRAARGEISNDQVLANIYAKFSNVATPRP
ncbi:MAG TPA: antitoxin VbhA family protein [Acidobacteriaceae bacterium]|jgi:hypothetical protein|nr:antitoxin VbhA family protein [Acidobacteriaceae bacterium]